MPTAPRTTSTNSMRLHRLNKRSRWRHLSFVTTCRRWVFWFGGSHWPLILRYFYSSNHRLPTCLFVQDAHEFLTTVLYQIRKLSPLLEQIAASKGKIYTCPVEKHLLFKMQTIRTCRRSADFVLRQSWAVYWSWHPVLECGLKLSEPNPNLDCSLILFVLYQLSLQMFQLCVVVAL